MCPIKISYFSHNKTKYGSKIQLNCVNNHDYFSFDIPGLNTEWIILSGQFLIWLKAYFLMEQIVALKF